MQLNILRESTDFIFTPHSKDVCIALQIEYTRLHGSRFLDHNSFSSETSTNQGEFSEEIYFNLCNKHI